MSKKRTIHCKYFTGIQNDVCNKGIKYSSLETSGIIRYPCCISCREPENTERAKCPHCEYPTQEELEREEAETNIELDNIIKTRAVILEYMQGKTGTAQIKCPICGNSLRFTVSPLNGHIHAKCFTPGCVAWME